MSITTDPSHTWILSNGNVTNKTEELNIKFHLIFKWLVTTMLNSAEVELYFTNGISLEYFEDLVKY